MAHAGDRVIAGQPLVAFRNTELELDVLDREGRLVNRSPSCRSYEKSLEDTRMANEKAAADIDYNITRLARAADAPARLVTAGYVAARPATSSTTSLPTTTSCCRCRSDNNARQEALRRRSCPGPGRSGEPQQSLVDHPPQAGQPGGQGADHRPARRPAEVGENHNRGDRLARSCPTPASRSPPTSTNIIWAGSSAGQGAHVT